MICESCLWAGHKNSLGQINLAVELHQSCKGDCACQHKTGPGWFIKAGQKPKPMQTQSP